MSEWRSLVERARRFNPTVADLGLVVAVYSVAGHSSRRSAVISGLAFLVALAALMVIADLKYPQE